MKKPKGFFTYFHLSEMLELLTDDQAGRLYKALLRYGDTGELTDFSDDQPLMMAFIMMRKEIDINVEKYNKTCERNRENGKKGGRPKKEQQDFETAGEKPKRFFYTQYKDNDNEKYNVNDNEMIKEIKRKTC
nr:DUF6291 domain-containing protein [uncultured Ruminococcus sp.]